VLGSVNKLVMDFYDRLLDSDEIGRYFDDIEMPRLIDHQTKFIAMLLGGPVSYSDDQLGNAHKSLGITTTHFEEMKQLLQETLDDHGFEPEDAQSVLNEIEARRPTIVSPHAT
jgi:hemoglobin